MDAQASKDVPKKKKKEKKSSESKKQKNKSSNDTAEAQISEDVEFEPVKVPIDEEGFIQSFDIDQVDEFVQFFKRYVPSRRRHTN